MNKLEATAYSALQLVRHRYDPEKDSSYGQFSSIYMAPTGNVVDTMAPFKNAAHVLTVGGAGAFGLEAKINKAKKVDIFDCNELQRLFFELVRTSIKIFTYNEFMEYFTLKVQSPFTTYAEAKNLLSPQMFYKIKNLLPYDAAFLFDLLYSNINHADMLFSGLFRFEHAMYREYLKRFASMYDEEKYYELQKMLRSEASVIDYKQVSLIDVPDKFTGPYDLIVLGNIPQYYESIPGLDTPYAFDMFIKKRLSKLLAPDGTIIVNYCFGLATTAIKEFMGIPYTPNRFTSNYVNKLFLKEHMKKDINLGLLKRGGYEYFFIDGVEMMEGQPLENACLIYKPNNSLKRK